MTGRTVLVVEPFLNGSHEAWATGWQAASRHDVHLLGLRGEGWRRAMRFGAVIMAERAAAWVAEHGVPDVVVGTNMLDLAGFLGLARRALGPAPAVQFMHENQLTYPRQPGEPLDLGLAAMQWRGLVAADEVWFNSEHHRDALLDALRPFARPVDSAVDAAAVAAKSWVAHIGIAADACRRATPAAGPRRPLVVSNQRWHHDKDLGSVLRALRTAHERGLDFDLALLGDPRGGEATELDPLIADLGERVVEIGHLPRRQYLDTLRRADVVVSAARNENFGIAVVEAIAAGAWPVVPDALAYREVVPARFHEACLYEAGALGARLRDVLGQVAGGASAPVGLADAMARFDWSVVGTALDDRVEHLLMSGPAV